MKRLLVILIAVTMLFSFFACRAQNGARVTIEMKDGGEIVLEMFPKDAPKTVENFLKLVNEKFYDGLFFHRVVPGFVVQTGDPKGTGIGDPGYTIKFEASPRKHITGALAMARKKDLDSAGSQFYICLADQPTLDGKYCVFGQVVSGMEVVQKIKRGDIMNRVYVSN